MTDKRPPGPHLVNEMAFAAGSPLVLGPGDVVVKPAAVPADQTCDDCFYVRTVGGSLQCRKNVPSAVFSTNSNQVFTAWPTVQPFDWCGEFKAKP
jgi:hypothetical protein